MTYARDSRFAGETKYTLRKMIRFAFNGITSFSEVPLVISSWMGEVVTLAGLLLIVYIVIGKLLQPETVETGWPSLMATVIFFGGVQLLSLGILGQYLGRVYREVKRRPLYVVEASWGIHGATPKRSMSVIPPAARGDDPS